MLPGLSPPKYGGEALNATGVNADSELRVAKKIYYPQPLYIVSSPAPIPLNPCSTSSTSKPNATSTPIISFGKEKEQQP